jgi:hypothetical protein
MRGSAFPTVKAIQINQRGSALGSSPVCTGEMSLSITVTQSGQSHLCKEGDAKVTGF